MTERKMRTVTVDTDRPLGTQRDDDLLSLDETALPRRRAMVSLAAHTLRLSLGVNCPANMQAGERMRSPVPGDFVVEWTVGMRRGVDNDTLLKGHGYLIDHRREAGEEVWYVQYGPAPEDVCRWANAEFFAFPINGERWDR